MGRQLPTIFLLALLAGVPGAAASVESRAAGAALERYVAAGARESHWSAEMVDIDASLPKLGEHGHLRAIRWTPPAGEPVYQVLAMDGDRTVRQQVIARYLSGEKKAAGLPSSKVAITPANYRFRYRGSVEAGGTRTYVFEIVPRKKRLGLIRGEMWIDAAGSVLHQAGRLVRSPSIFIRHVQVVRDTETRCGMAVARVTHVQVDTRLAGKADLTITERPYSGPGDQGMSSVDGATVR
jgi:hypothetical protein